MGSLFKGHSHGCCRAKEVRQTLDGLGWALCYLAEFGSVTKPLIYKREVILPLVEEEITHLLPTYRPPSSLKRSKR